MNCNYTIAYLRMSPTTWMCTILSREKYNAMHVPVPNADGSIQLRFPPQVSGWYETVEEAKRDLSYARSFLP